MNKERRKHEQALKMALDKRARELGGVGFSEWLSAEATARERRLSKGKIESRTSYLDALTTRGAAAEQMLGMGLGNSGYARYLDTRAKKTHEEELAELEGEYDRAAADDLGDYEAHVAGLKKQRDDLYNKITTELVASGVVNYDDAYEAALNSGLDTDTSKLLARRVTTKVRYRLRSKVLNKIVTEGLSRKAAQTYAEALGLEEEDARQLGGYAYRISQARINTGVTPVRLIEVYRKNEEKLQKEEEIRNERS